MALPSAWQGIPPAAAPASRDGLSSQVRSAGFSACRRAQAPGGRGRVLRRGAVDGLHAHGRSPRSSVDARCPVAAPAASGLWPFRWRVAGGRIPCRSARRPATMGRPRGPAWQGLCGDAPTRCCAEPWPAHALRRTWHPGLPPPAHGPSRAIILAQGRSLASNAALPLGRAPARSGRGNPRWTVRQGLPPRREEGRHPRRPLAGLRLRGRGARRAGWRDHLAGRRAWPRPGCDRPSWPRRAPCRHGPPDRPPAPSRCTRRSPGRA